MLTSPALAADYFHLGGSEVSRIGSEEQYSNTDGSMTTASVAPGESDDLFFYNSNVTIPANSTLITGPYPIAFNSMTFRSNAGTTQIDRGVAPQNPDVATFIGIGAGGITVDSGAGAVTIGGIAQRVVIGAVADFSITNNSSNDLRFDRVLDARTEYTTHTVTITGEGSGDTVFVEGIKANSSGRDLAITINTTGTGVVGFEGNNTYTGVTTVTAGKLIINGNASSADGSVSVSADATLGGNGTLGGDVTIANNGRLEFDLGTPSDSPDSMDLAASLTFAGDSVLTIASRGGTSVGKHTLITTSNGIFGIVPATLNLPDGWEAAVSIVGNDLVLDLTSVGTP